MLREASKVRSDGFLRCGVGRVSACDVASGGGGGGGRGGSLHLNLELHMRHVLLLQGASSSLRFQELVDRYSSRFDHKILHRYLYASFSFSVWNLSRNCEKCFLISLYFIRTILLFLNSFEIEKNVFE